ncbi:protein tesmin/TSO1-like CXC 6 [Sphaeramia orbicularis]|uniref:protein tesmin/TSO1-like CXC 6 n=1 Tax=Sphaeramia orbicularis TaxID=375764 RepID=UPI001180D762|nr:protein tesmin/TSO1-like CXC 6 [Sphaeramia orbicularis]
MSFPICSTNKSDPPIPAEIHESAGPPSYVSPQVQPLQLGMMDPFNYSAVAGPSQPSDSLGCVPEAVQWSLNTDLQTSASSVCSPPRMEQQCEGGASVDPPPHNNITVPILCTVSTGGLVWLRNLFQPKPQCQNLHPAPANVNENRTLNKDHLGTHIQGDFTDTMTPTSPAPYCSCFANGLMCNNCNCSNCFNNEEHKLWHLRAVQSCQKRNPNAFRPKVIQALSRGVKGWHAKGCKCKRSHCLKNYCECFEADISCTPTCKCVGCMNKF